MENVEDKMKTGFYRDYTPMEFYEQAQKFCESEHAEALYEIIEKMLDHNVWDMNGVEIQGDSGLNMFNAKGKKVVGKGSAGSGANVALDYFDIGCQQMRRSYTGLVINIQHD